MKIPKNTIIIGFPCIGKSTAAKNMVNAIDLESSRYMFEDSLIDSVYGGNEELAKGDPNRVRYPDANERYYDAILDAEKSDIDYVIVCPSAINDLLRGKESGEVERDIFLVQPEDRESLIGELEMLSSERGNTKTWQDGFLPYAKTWLVKNKELFKAEQIVELPKGTFLQDVLESE